MSEKAKQTKLSILRKLDAEVAERVMGFRWFHCTAKTGVERNQLLTLEQSATWRELGWQLTKIPSPPPADQFNDDSELRRYSSDIAAAMEVVNAMRARGYRFNAQTPHGRGWEVQCYPKHSPPKGEKFRALLPEAICRAALAALVDGGPVTEGETK